MTLLQPHPDVTLYKGDALSILRDLPDNSVDAIITDPPYCSGAFTLAAKQAPPDTKYKKSSTQAVYTEFACDARDQRSFILWGSMWLSECLRIAKISAPLLVFSDWRQLPATTDYVQIAGWSWRGVVVWHKPSSRPLPGEFRRECEFIAYARKGVRGDIEPTVYPELYSYSAPSGPKRKHLTQKPIELMRDLMRIVPQGGTVLDPFIGSGTTAEAAILTGRKCIGIEMVKANIDIAAARVAPI